MIEAYPNRSNLLHLSDQLSGQSLTEKPNQSYFMCSHTYILSIKFSLHLITLITTEILHYAIL